MLCAVTEPDDRHAAVRSQLKSVRGAHVARLDTAPNVDIPLLEEAARGLPGYLATHTRSRRIANLLRHAIGELVAESDISNLLTLFGFDQDDTVKPHVLREIVRKRTDSPNADAFARPGGPEEKMLGALAAQIIAEFLSKPPTTATDEASRKLEAALDGGAQAQAKTSRVAGKLASVPRRGKIVIGVVSLLVVAVLVYLWLKPGVPEKNSPSGLHHEQKGRYPTQTYSNPLQAPDGPQLAPYQMVDVSCKVYAVPFPSALPDGYWYRIESTPWNGRYYALANTFLNGDRIGSAAAPTNTDSAVPDCVDG